MPLIKRIPRLLLRWFLQGLLLSAPLGLTLYALYFSFTYLDGLAHYKVPGLGILFVLAGVTLIGALGSTLIAQPLLSWLEKGLEKTPLIKVIYGSVKDLLSAFVGEEKPFNKPVLVLVSEMPKMYKLGFITREHLEPEIFGPDKTGVYLPKSYGFVGDYVVVNSNQLKPIDWPAAEVMKHIISGGIVGVQTKKAMSNSQSNDKTLSGDAEGSGSI